MIRTFLSRLAGLFAGRRRDRELDDEVRFHLEMLVEAHLRAGMNERDARTAALRSFGGVVQMKEAYREQRGLPVVETFFQDARYALRTIFKAPAFTVAALVTLTVGIGATSAIFTVVNAVLLQPPPYSAPERIVELFRHSGGLYNGHTYTRFAFFKEHMRSVEAFAAWRGTAFNLVSGDHAEHVNGLAVSEEYFRVFGGTPLFGRTFEADEDVPGGAEVVVIRQALWERLFGSDPSALGRTLLLGDKSHTIVGIMPEGFDSAHAGDFYVPLQPGPRGPGSGFNYRIAARLRPGVTPAQANLELANLFASLRASQPDAVFVNEQPPRMLLLQESLSRDVKPALLILLGAVGMLLLIACANTASLLLARAAGRSREMAVRAALGAPRGRIIRQLLTESALIFVAGGLLGVVLAYWTVPILLAVTPPGYLPAREVEVDGLVLLATLALSLTTGLIFGLAPALNLSGRQLVEAFKEDGSRTTSGRSQWLRRVLVVGEVALCMLLLVAAGLLVQTFIKLRAVELGFEPDNVLTARMSLLGERYSTAAAVSQYYERGLERIRQIPGVQSAAAVNGVPIEFGLNLNFDRLDTPEVEAHLTDWRYATPGYFGVMGIDIVEGRGLTPQDGAGSPRVAVVSQQFARQHYRDRSPIGQQIQLFKEDGPITIVGIARDLREAGLRGTVPAVMYVPVAQAGDTAIRIAHMYFQVSWVVKAAGLTSELRERIREELRSLDPKQPITAFRTMDDVRSRAMAFETFQMTLIGIFAGIGLLLAAAGIYGLVAYSVTERTREFGIRMALGATRRDVMSSVLRQGAALAGVGVLAGAVAAAGLAQTLQALVFDISTLDALTFAVVGVLLIAMAVVASALPASRAVRLNPVTALRE